MAQLAQPAPRRRYFAALVVVIGLLAIGLGLWMGQAPEKEGPTLRPSETTRAKQKRDRRRASASIPPAQGIAAAEQAPPSTTLEVHKVRRDRLDRHTFIMRQLRPEYWMPRAEEVGLSNSPTYAAWDAYLDTKSTLPSSAQKTALAETLQLAEENGETWGQLPQDLDPWHGLLALNMAWVESKVDYSAALSAQMDEFRERFGAGPFEGRPYFVNTNPEARQWWDAQEHERDSSQVLAIAAALEEQHPGHPVNDFALLFELDAFSQISGSHTDYSAASELALFILAETEDDLVAEAAVYTLANGAHAELTDTNWDSLEQAALEFPDQSSTIAVYALDAAFAADDHLRAAKWLMTLESALPEQCDCSGEHLGCEIQCRWLEAGTRQLRALGSLPAQTWQQALHAQVTRCSWETEHPEQRVLAAAQWDQGWQWTTFGAEGDFASCVQDATTDQPHPKQGQDVDLIVHPN